MRKIDLRKRAERGRIRVRVLGKKGEGRREGERRVH